MKRILQIALVLLVSSVAWAQKPIQAPDYDANSLTFPVFSLNPVPVPGGTITLVGQPGQATWYLWASANFQLGSVVSFLGSVQNAPNTLSVSNYLSIFPNAYPAGVSTVDILATTTPVAPSGACNCAVATGLTSGGTNFQSNTLSSYTVSLLNPATYEHVLRVEAVGSNSAHLLLRNAFTGALITDLDTAASGSGVTGSGTAGLIPVWTSSTSLGNSDIQDNAGSSIILSSQGTPAALTGNTAVFATGAPSSSCTTGVLTFPLVAWNQGCQTYRGIESLAGSGTGTVIAGSFFSQPATGGPVLAIGVLGNVQPGTTPSSNNIGVYGNCNINNAGVSLTNCRGGFFYGNNGGTTTIASVEGVAIESGVTTNGGTTTTDTTLHILSPNITGSGTMTHHYGLLIEDQTTATSGTNSDPHGIGQLGNAPNVFTGHLNQNASGNWAGTCTMSTTSCTITLTTAFSSTPGCVATVQGSTAIAVACSVSGATVTITAASSNTATWAAFVFGNPN